MAGKIDQRLAELGIALPTTAAPAGNYVPYTVSGRLVFVSGQVPVADGKVHYVGKLGRDLDVEEGKAAARMVGLNVLAQVKAACGGDLDRVVRCLRLGGFVNCVDGFTEQPQVINGCSDLMVEIFGDKGRHARFAVGANALPLGVAVEIESAFEID